MSKNQLVNPKDRPKPTSPHLQIYRWNISSITSIMHRLTGVGLYFSILIIAWCIVFYTYSFGSISEQESCECITISILKALFFGAIIFVTFSLYYHFCNGVRHLFWDIGKGFDLKRARLSGYLVLLTSLILTIITIAITIYLKLF
ncbi:MAG: succinate dehydrogenase, cytochrome b556 subunit [Proteobacteria bacterium]|nr:succinate dehydrogenase, cytochrome b556 subunit [Pseudomonadota bacterium]NCA27670.1 succinate dehydrogenase, cytochrome b556 subunit [Pseudomonadota bacterium]